MKNIEEKKIPIKLIIFSCIGITVSFLFKTPYDEYLNQWKYRQKENVDIPMEWYKLDLFNYLLDFKYISIILICMLGLSIYLLIFKTDSEIKSFFKMVKVKIVSYISDSSINTYWKRFNEKTKSSWNLIYFIILLIIILLIYKRCQ